MSIDSQELLKINLSSLYLKENHQSHNTTISVPQLHKNTMFQFRTGFTPKKSKAKLNLLLDENHGPQTQTIPTVKHLNFQNKQKYNSPKLSLKINIPSISNNNQLKKYDRFEGQISQFSSSDNIQIKNDYIKLFQEDLSSKLPEQVTFRNKTRLSNDRLEDNRQNLFNFHKSPPANDYKKKPSIQFASKSPKYIVPRQSGQHKLQKIGSSFDFNLNCTNYENQIKDLKNKVMELQTIKTKNQQNYQTQKVSHAKKQQLFILEISYLNKTISELQDKLVLKEEQFQDKSNIFLDQINQLIKDRQILERKLKNVIIPTTMEGDQKIKILTQIQENLNAKDDFIQSLQNQNHQLSTRISELNFQISNVKSRSLSYQQLNISSQLSVFQQALKYSIQQISRYKQRIQKKDQEIDKIKQIFGIQKGQTQRTKNQLSIEQLKRITEVQTLRTTFEAERVLKNNQITDLTQELNLLKSKIKSLSQQVKQKDQFIMTKIKINQK